MSGRPISPFFLFHVRVRTIADVPQPDQVTRVQSLYPQPPHCRFFLPAPPFFLGLLQILLRVGLCFVFCLWVGFLEFNFVLHFRPPPALLSLGKVFVGGDHRLIVQAMRSLGDFKFRQACHLITRLLSFPVRSPRCLGSFLFVNLFFEIVNNIILVSQMYILLAACPQTAAHILFLGSGHPRRVPT